MTFDAARRAIQHARDGKGPYILEMLTYRYRGHSMSDPAKYRSKDEVTTMRAEHDPIEQVKSRILEKRYGSEESLKQIEAEVRAIITDAADFATNDAEPAASELWTDVYAEA
jgi:pyruvate dehydrogenase E1 component alpha subunit